MVFEWLRVGGGDFGLRNIDRRRFSWLWWFLWNPFGISLTHDTWLHWMSKVLSGNQSASGCITPRLQLRLER